MHTHTHTHTHTCVCVYIYITTIYVCVCIYIRKRTLGQESLARVGTLYVRVLMNTFPSLLPVWPYPPS